MRILTTNQELLMRYLRAVGCDKAATVHIVLELWDEDAVIEMLEFCRDNPKASQAELLEACSRIYMKYKEIIDAIPEFPIGEIEDDEEY